MSSLFALFGIFSAVVGGMAGFDASGGHGTLWRVGFSVAGTLYGYILIYGGCTLPGALFMQKVRKDVSRPPSTTQQIALLLPVVASPFITGWSAPPVCRWLVAHLGA